MPNLNGPSESPVIEGFQDLARLYSGWHEEFFFIQVGANDGKHKDPIHELVTAHNWQGILLEPQKEVLQNELIPNYAKQKGLTFINAAIDEANGFRDLYKLSFSSSRWATGLASFNRHHLQHHIDNGYVERMAKSEGIDLPDCRGDWITSEKVNIMTFESLFREYQVTRLDLLQIDTEGFDHEILKLYNFHRLAPSIIQFEHHLMSKDEQQSSLDLLDRLGYLTFQENINTIGFKQNIAIQKRLGFEVYGLRLAAGLKPN